MEYSIEGYTFRLEEFFPSTIKDQITDVRVSRPEVVLEEARSRKRRARLTNDGKLTILAADHPGRRVTSSGGQSVLMGDRVEYLGRVLRVLSGGEIDGVMATTDVIEELFVVDHLLKRRGGPSLLDEKVIIGCMNRGGLAGTTFELDDRFTSFTAERIQQMKLDGAKTMFRVADDEESSLRTLEYNARAINDLNRYGIPVFVEPLPVEREGGKYKVQKRPDPLIQLMGVASAIGDSSMGLWLKIPYCEDYERVARATTLPILMLGGESAGSPTGIFDDFSKGMRAGKNVRGALVGRNVTFPGDDDPRAVASAVHAIIHQGADTAAAVERVIASRGKEMDALTRYLSR